MSSRPVSVHKTIEHIVPELTGGTIHRESATQPGHLIDKIHQAQVEVIFNQCEGADADSFARAAMHFLQCSTSGAFAGRVNQDQITALEVSGRLAIRNADDLFVAGRLAMQHMTGKAKPGLDVGEVLRHTAFRLIERYPQKDPRIEETYWFG